MTGRMRRVWHRSLTNTPSFTNLTTMHITVFGATGRTGIPLVWQALDRGHDVTAFVRSPEKLTVEDEALTVVEGDVYTGEGVDEAVAGADAVISVLGPTGDGPDDLMTAAGEHIVEAMDHHDVARLIAVVGGSIGWETGQMSLVLRTQRFFLTRLTGDALEDQENHAAHIRATDLDWTIVRAPWLTTNQGTGAYRAGDISLELERLSRSDLARFLLDCVDDNRFIRELPSVGKA